MWMRSRCLGVSSRAAKARLYLVSANFSKLKENGEFYLLFIIYYYILFIIYYYISRAEYFYVY